MVFRADRLIPRTGLALAALALIPVAGIARRKAPPPPAVTLVCERELKTATGSVKATRTLDADGRLIGTAGGWVYRLGTSYGDTMFQAGWYGRDGAELDFNDGWLGVEFDTISIEAKRRLKGKSYAVELSTSDRPNLSGLHFRGPIANFSYFATRYPDVSLDWGDVAAMARGADRLFIAARDKDYKLLRSVEIDRAIFAKAVADVAALAEQVRRDATDPAKNCRRETESNDIVI